MSAVHQKFASIENELRSLKQPADKLLGGTLDPQKLQGALNEWLAKIEQHMNEIEEKVALQASEMCEMEKRVEQSLRKQIKEFTQQTQDYV